MNRVLEEANGADCERAGPVLVCSRSGQLGGMEIRLADEARFFSEKGIPCLLAISAFPGSDAWLSKVAQSSPRIHAFDFEPPPFFEDAWRWRHINLLRSWTCWPRRLRRARIALAHIGYAWTLEGGTRLWLCTRAGIPSVLSVHNTFPLARLTGWHHRIAQEGFRGVKGIYGVSKSALDRFVEIYGEFLSPTTLLQVVPNFVDIDRFVPSEERRIRLRGQLGISHDAFVVGSVGRLDVQKEPLRVLRMFEALLETDPQAHLVFCGAGPLESEVRGYIEARALAGKVHLLGFREDAENVYPALDVHVLLSRQEGFGIATAEAMACNVPVLATDVPGTRDVVQGSGAGTLVPYEDEKMIGAALCRLRRNVAERDAASRAARPWVTARFSKERWQATLEGFYQQIWSVREFSA